MLTNPTAARPNVHLLTFVILFLACFLVFFCMRITAGKNGLPVAPSGAVRVFYGVSYPLTTSIFPAEGPIIWGFCRTNDVLPNPSRHGTASK
jgi:hypothetical protein